MSLVALNPCAMECHVLAAAEGECWQLAALDAVVETFMRGGDAVILVLGRDGQWHKITIEAQGAGEAG
ncbi:MAG TPA: hypothetical protein VFT22_10990 [Kofleriaceae bacterium]|nr:hypothetical protein [Kofleriaceae bacterium]